MRKPYKRLAAVIALGLSFLLGASVPFTEALPAFAAPGTLFKSEDPAATGNDNPTEPGGENPNPGDTTDTDVGGSGDGATNPVDDDEASSSEAGEELDSITEEEMSLPGLFSVPVDGGDYHMPNPGRPYLKFEIKDPVTAQPIAYPGSTVTIQGPRRNDTGSNDNRWNQNGSVLVTDCVTGDEPCGSSSLDQDSRPGRFAVDRLSAGETPATMLSSTSRYRIGAGPAGATPVGYRWTTDPLSGTNESTATTATVTAVIAAQDGGTANNTVNVAAPGEWVSVANPGGTGSNMVHDFARTQANAGPPVLAQSPSITWNVKQAGALKGGATVVIQGPRTASSTWGASYQVADCTSDPCAVNSMDQDPVAGQFKIFNLRNTSGGFVPLATGTSNSRYRLLPASSTAPLNTQFVSAADVIQNSTGDSNSTSGTWNGTPPSYSFGDLAVQTAPSLVWQVRNGGASGPLVGGATTRIRVSTAANNNPSTGETDIVDCTSAPAPCSADSADQDPTPGAFRVYKLNATTAVLTDRRYQIRPEGNPPTFTEWVTTAGTWGGNISPQGAITGNPPQYTFNPLILRDSPSLVWDVREGNQATGPLVGGATVKVSGPRTTNFWGTVSWGTEYEVTDCTAAPCGSLMDQDPTAGKFRVHRIGFGGSQTQVVSNRRYRIMAFSSPFGKQWTSPTQGNVWVDSTGTNDAGTNWNNNQYAFANLVLAPANSLKWTVQEQGTNIPVGAATVRLQSGTNGPIYYISDCTEQPCHPDSMDQDWAPGVFQVDTLRGLDGTSQTAVDVTRTQYRLATAGSLPGYEWVTPSTSWQTTPTWQAGNLQNEFTLPLRVQPRSPDFDPSAFCAAPTDGRYYTLSRGTGTSNTSSIYALRPTVNGAGVETGIDSWADPVTNSTGTTVGTGQTANALGVTPTGVFFYTGQGGSDSETRRNVTVYRFDPKFDTAPYPVMNMDLLSPTTGTVVSGDATIYEGREEFYFAYYSDSPVQIDGGDAIRFHLYRYSAGNGDRTGEVRHIDVPKPNGMNNYNGDFAFTATNDLQFIISDNGGRFSSGVVTAADFIHQPSAHALPAVTAIQGTAVTSSVVNTNLQSINGIAYTKSGRAIMQRNANAAAGNENFLGTAPNLSMVGSAQQFNGYLVDLASCDSPSTITVKKEVVGPRYNANDQFTLNAQRQVGTQAPELFAPTTTNGPATGVQENQIGPFVMTLDGTFSANETFTQNEDRYESAYECSILGANGQPGTPFLTSGGFAPDTTNRSLSFSLNDRNVIKPGDQVECVFKNRRYAAELKVSKTSEPATGTVVDGSTDANETLVRYVLTFDNSDGSAPARNIAYTDWLKDVFDDADAALFEGGHRFEYRSATSGQWSATPPASPNQVVGNDANIAHSSEPTVAFSGQVPAHEVRQVSFLVKVKKNSENTANRMVEAAPLKGFLLRNYLTQNNADTGAPTPPPATCVIPAAPGLPLCAEHPISAWTLSKDAAPGRNSSLHKGGNAHYKLTATKVNSASKIENLVFTDDLTDVFKTAGFAPDAAVPGGALKRGIYFFNAAGQTLGADGSLTATQPAAVLEGDAGVPLPVLDAGRWILTSPAVTLPENAVKAELWFAVQAGEITTGNTDPAAIPAGTYPPHKFDPLPATGSTFTNFVTANGAVSPLNCITGVADPAITDPAFPAECRVTHRMQDNYFTIRKDASGPAVDRVNVRVNDEGQTEVTDASFGAGNGLDTSGMTDMVGHEFALRDRSPGSGTVPDFSSKYLCRTSYNPNPPTNWNGTFNATSDAGEDWGSASATLAAIKAWNAANPANPRPLCAVLYMQGNIANLSSPEATSAGAQNGRWRSENLPAGDFWLIETKAPDRQINRAGNVTRPVPGVQLLAQPIPFTVWPDDPSTPTWSGGQSQQGLGQLDVLSGSESGAAPGTDRPTPTVYGDRCSPGANVASRPTSCVNPTGYLLLVKDTGPTPLPLTGGQWLALLTTGGAIALLVALGGAWWWRRRQTVELASLAPGAQSSDT